MNKRYTLWNTTSTYATIIFRERSSYANCKNMAKYLSKYYILKASIRGQNIIINNVFKMKIFNNLWRSFEIYPIIVQAWMYQNTKTPNDKKIFKAVKKKFLKWDLIKNLSPICLLRNLIQRYTKLDQKKKYLQWFQYKQFFPNTFKTKHSSKHLKSIKNVTKSHISQFHNI